MGISNLFGKKKEYEPAEIYLRLRNQIFDLPHNPVDSLLKDSALIGMLVETGYLEAVVTLVTLADGTVSLYFSNGGGMLGLGEHQPVRKASLDFLLFANRFILQAMPAADYPLPAEGYTTFYFITDKGVLFSTAEDYDLATNRLPLSPLLFRAHDVISQARLAKLADEKGSGISRG